MQIYYLGKKNLYKNLILLIKSYLLSNKYKLLIKKKFIIVILNINNKIFIIYIVTLKLKK